MGKTFPFCQIIIATVVCFAQCFLPTFSSSSVQKYRLKITGNVRRNRTSPWCQSHFRSLFFFLKGQFSSQAFLSKLTPTAGTVMPKGPSGVGVQWCSACPGAGWATARIPAARSLQSCCPPYLQVWNIQIEGLAGVGVFLNRHIITDTFLCVFLERRRHF